MEEIYENPMILFQLADFRSTMIVRKVDDESQRCQKLQQTEALGTMTLVLCQVLEFQTPMIKVTATDCVDET